MSGVLEFGAHANVIQFLGPLEKMAGSDLFQEGWLIYNRAGMTYQ